MVVLPQEKCATNTHTHSLHILAHNWICPICRGVEGKYEWIIQLSAVCVRLSLLRCRCLWVLLAFAVCLGVCLCRLDCVMVMDGECTDIILLGAHLALPPSLPSFLTLNDRPNCCKNLTHCLKEQSIFTILFYLFFQWFLAIRSCETVKGYANYKFVKENSILFHMV